MGRNIGKYISETSAHCSSTVWGSATGREAAFRFEHSLESNARPATTRMSDNYCHCHNNFELEPTLTQLNVTIMAQI